MAPQIQKGSSRKKATSNILESKKQRSLGDRNSEKAIPRKILPVELQQLLLDIFKNAFASRFNYNLQPLIQEVKQHLFSRDFVNAFGKECLLEAYAMRWSPSRALAYADLLCTCPKIAAALKMVILEERRQSCNDVELPGGPILNATLVNQDDSSRKVNVVCLGGGAGAELLAFATYLRYISNSLGISNGEGAIEPGGQVYFRMNAVDIKDWSNVLETLHAGLTTAPEVFQSAKAEALAVNEAFIDSSAFELNFQQHDVLDMDASALRTLLEDCQIVTIMFTLNELYCTSMKATTNLLLSMTSLLSPGALLLVVDSPGSYSTVTVGKVSADEAPEVQKKYPMQWLLDHTLLEAAAVKDSERRSRDPQWEKIDARESKWFRLQEDLKYPIGLEDMRYQYHLYRRL